jgi:hypothetical protein
MPLVEPFAGTPYITGYNYPSHRLGKIHYGGIIVGILPGSRGHLARIIEDSIVEDQNNNTVNFDVNKFIAAWYTQGGGSFYFLFRNSLKTTNIQFSELLSLLRRYTYYAKGYGPHTGDEEDRSEGAGGGHPADPRDRELGRADRNIPALPFQFNSSKELKARLLGLWESLGVGSKEEWVDRRDFFIDYYSDLFLCTILVDCFYGSAVVHVPRSLHIDHKYICAESGYVYSCGRAIYIRKTMKASVAELENNLKLYLRTWGNKKKILFTTFSHEQFFEEPDPYSSQKISIVPGLTKEREDIKVYLSKYYFDALHIDDLLTFLGETFNEHLFITGTGGARSFQDECDKYRSEENKNLNLSIWLLVDSSIAIYGNHPGDNKYFIVYGQEYRNRNPFIVFDEMKPGWIAPVTLPHTLAAAMLNITRPYWPDTDKVFIVDPFGGSGTTYLESIKYGGKVEFYSTDLNDIYEIVVKDNLRFFSLKKDELQTLVEFISGFEKRKEKMGFNRSYLKQQEARKNLYKWAEVLFENETRKYRDKNQMKTLREIHSHEFSPGFKENFYKEDGFFYGRILFYLMWRATVRNIYDIFKGRKDQELAIIEEIVGFKNAVEELMRIRENEEDRPDDVFNFKEQLLSKECVINANIAKHHLNLIIQRGELVRAGDALEVLKETRETNVIITDPPYGFNTDVKEATSLAKLYKEVIPAMIDSLSDEGQIIFCLPDASRNSQSIAAFTTEEFVINSIFAAVRECGYCEIVQSAFIHPHPSKLFDPPYYWESAKALRRKILHFKILKNTEKKKPKD